MFLFYLPDFSSDSTKLLLFIFAVAALFVIMRLIARRNENARNFGQQFGTEQDLASDAHQAVPSVHPPMRFDQVELKRFYMREFDVMNGPPDPFEFVDELTAEVEHVDTGEKSKWEFTIGTPAGFARLLERKGWESFFSPEIFVIRKYELEMVREMIVEHIQSTLGQTGAPPSR